MIELFKKIYSIITFIHSARVMGGSIILLSFIFSRKYTGRVMGGSAEEYVAFAPLFESPTRFCNCGLVHSQNIVRCTEFPDQSPVPRRRKRCSGPPTAQDREMAWSAVWMQVCCAAGFRSRRGSHGFSERSAAYTVSRNRGLR